MSAGQSRPPASQAGLSITPASHAYGGEVTIRSTLPARSPRISARSAGVAVADLGPARRSGQHVVEVLLGERDPALFELHADGAPVEQGGLDDRGADPGQGIDDEGAGVGVLGDDAPGEFGEHLARMAGAVRQVAAGPLPLGGGLGHRPDGQRHGRGWCGGGGCGHGRPTTGQASPIEQGVRPSF